MRGRTQRRNGTLVLTEREPCRIKTEHEVLEERWTRLDGGKQAVRREQRFQIGNAEFLRQPMQATRRYNEVELAEISGMVGVDQLNVPVLAEGEVCALMAPAIRLEHGELNPAAMRRRQQHLRERAEPDLEHAQCAVGRPEALVLDQRAIQRLAGLTRRDVGRVVEVQCRLRDDRFRRDRRTVFGKLAGETGQRRGQQQFSRARLLLRCERPDNRGRARQ